MVRSISGADLKQEKMEVRITIRMKLLTLCKNLLVFRHHQLEQCYYTSLLQRSTSLFSIDQLMGATHKVIFSHLNIKDSRKSRLDGVCVQFKPISRFTFDLFETIITFKYNCLEM